MCSWLISLFFVGFLPQTLEGISAPFFRNHFAAIFIHQHYSVLGLLHSEKMFRVKPDVPLKVSLSYAENIKVYFY